MINETLKFLSEEINKFLALKLGATTDPRLILGNIARAFDNDTGGSNSLTNKAILSLVNIEEDRLSRPPENFIRTETGVVYKNPAVYLNLYVLFAVNREYSDSLKWLAIIIQFFQYQNVFTPADHPSLDSRIEKLVVDLHTLSFEQMNHLWGILGGKLLPSVLYKLRLVIISEEAIVAGGGYIQEIVINERTKPVLS